ncbi:MAG TPA: oxygenase MpaB family protein [Candidatus Dormibacteraeota bacterium]|nr:oxygenase MpaB family protein [Candidatus Dormibacteraeota bacterium]
MDSVLPGLFAEDSITRRVNRENILLLGGGRAILMQLAHPKVAHGVDEHSDFRTQPIRRLRRTIRMTMAVVFGDRETALGAARAVNQVHAGVRGSGYRALDPDLLLWVHATLADTALLTYETFVQRLTPREREAFYQEFKLLGELLGIPDARFPATLRDFAAYLEDMMSSGPVRVEARARELARQILRPGVRLLPGPVMVPLEIITTGLLPPTLREQYGLAWGPSQQRVYRLALRTLPRLISLTPTRIRVWPLPGRTLRLTPRGRAVSS